MGVDYYPCKDCGETYADCGHYGNCSKCERDFCGNCYDKLVKKYGVINEKHERYSWYGESLKKCDFCSGKKVDDDELLNFALKKLDTTKAKLKKEYVEITYKSK